MSFLHGTKRCWALYVMPFYKKTIFLLNNTGKSQIASMFYGKANLVMWVLRSVSNIIIFFVTSLFWIERWPAAYCFLYLTLSSSSLQESQFYQEDVRSASHAVWLPCVFSRPGSGVLNRPVPGLWCTELYVVTPTQKNEPVYPRIVLCSTFRVCKFCVLVAF